MSSPADTNASRIYLSPPHLGGAERDYVEQAFASNWVAPLGPNVDEFEQALVPVVGVPHVAALSSGTAAIHLGLLLLGVKPGDEVIVPTLTFAATANPVVYCGARPVFVDSEDETWNLSPDLLESELRAAKERGRMPTAVIAVDLYGQCADLTRIARICEKYEVHLLEDAAESLGASWGGRPAGSFGACAALSFNGNKIVTTSGGGALVSKNPQLIQFARHLATQARDDAPHYEHSRIGFNYRMSNVLAGIGIGQLSVLVQRIAARRGTRAFYERALRQVPGISFMPLSTLGQWNGWLTVILIEPKHFGATREEVRIALEARNIESRPIWKPLHLQPVFSQCRRVGGEFAEKLFANGLCLPSGSSLSESQRMRVVEAILQVREAAARARAPKAAGAVSAH